MAADLGPLDFRGKKSKAGLPRTVNAISIGNSLQLSKPPGLGIKLPVKGIGAGVSTGFDPSQQKPKIIGGTVLKKQENKLKDSDESDDDGNQKAFAQQVIDPVKISY